MSIHCQTSMRSQPIELSDVWDAATSEYTLSFSMLYELSLQTFTYHTYILYEIIIVSLESLYVYTWVPLFKTLSYYFANNVLPNLERLILIRKLLFSSPLDH